MNTHLLSSLTHLSNDELLARVQRLVGREREATATLVAHLAELDQRRLYLAEGCSSLFTYATQVLHLSEHEAYARIEAARAARKFPLILQMLEDGSLHLSAVGLLAAHLTPENHQELLSEERHKTKRQVEEIVARVRPQPPVAPSVRRLPAPKPAPLRAAAPPESAGIPSPTAPSSASTPARLAAGATAAQPQRALVAPLAPERYQVRFTASVETHRKLRLAQDLLRHTIPDGDLAAVFDRALTALLADLSKKKLAATDRPRQSRGSAPGSRHIPANVRREVWRRDGGRCAFVGQNGRRCSETAFLELHHRTPHAVGGPSTASNLEIRCRTHNAHEAELLFGPRQPLVARERLVAYSAQTPGHTRISPRPLGPDRVPDSPRRSLILEALARTRARMPNAASSLAGWCRRPRDPRLRARDRIPLSETSVSEVQGAPHQVAQAPHPLQQGVAALLQSESFGALSFSC